ncbi:FUSC family protein [Actinomadura barringtoniae]|uniref:FUSC family protein n=1 Tax=Actinomadura barringtoniae TaxID=1427535 RepID=A0A939PGA6_9ACTN|nr:FUSC family protein [Actinomadura barringtoniae]MBO2449219.1 FUSC family protein [Actinomadura barringtoniae]
MRIKSLDPRLVELRGAVVAAVAMLSSFGTAVWLRETAQLSVNVVVLSVVLSVSLARTQQGADRRARWTGLVVLPVVAVGAGVVGALLHDRPGVGDALFVVGVSATIWVRRFGARAGKAGTVAAMPFLAVLMTPLPKVPGPSMLWWGALVAVIAFGWAWAWEALAIRVGFLPSKESAHEKPDPPKPGVSTRMALQMGVALAGAFVVGRLVFAPHWSWTVLTAFIVCSGNRGRGDVVYKSGLRVAGAVAGTVAATVLAGAFAPGAPASVAAILAILAVATWLRAVLGYAYWACCVTAVLALLYGYFGQSGTAVLVPRLGGILTGAALGIAASWFILPIKTEHVLRGRINEARKALIDLVAAVREEGTERGAEGFHRALERLDQITKPVEAHRFVHRRTRGKDAKPHPADMIDAVRRCREPVREALDGSAEALADLEGTARTLGRYLVSTRTSG